MRVVLVNHSDTRGGASVVTYRLMEALRRQGVDARMLVAHKSTDNPHVETAGSALRRRACFLYEHAGIYLHNGLSRDDLFKASTAVCGVPLHSHPWVREADAVILNWVNQGMLSLGEIARIEAPLIWTMHDMWCMTGVCHHAGSCPGYARGCGHCPLMHGGTTARDLAYRTFERKRALYASRPIHFVAVSHWLAARARRSALLRDLPVSVIPNAFPVDRFTAEPCRPRSHYGLPEHPRLVVMGAARLDDPIKGLGHAIEALNKLADMDVAAVLFGDLRDPSLLDRLAIPYVHLGPLRSMREVNDVYALCDVVLSSSDYETLPGTLVEGMAAGCVPVAFDRGGQADIIDHLSTGYIARYPDTSDLAAGLRWALGRPVDTGKLRGTVAERFGEDTVARAYIDLVSGLRASAR